MLVVVDDVPWLDAASRECVLYAARRAGGAVAVALAVREPDDEAFERSGCPRCAPRRSTPTRRSSCYAASRPTSRRPSRTRSPRRRPGNPLALVELPATLTAGQRAGIEALELPLAPG